MTPLETVRNVIQCDNGRDAAGYRALLRDDYVRVHGEVLRGTLWKGEGGSDCLPIQK